MKKEMRIGLILLGVYIVLERFLNTPDLILGFLMGLSLLYLVIGLMPEKTYTKIKEFKNASTR